MCQFQPCKNNLLTSLKTKKAGNPKVTCLKKLFTMVYGLSTMDHRLSTPPYNTLISFNTTFMALTASALLLNAACSSAVKL